MPSACGVSWPAGCYQPQRAQSQHVISHVWLRTRRVQSGTDVRFGEWSAKDIEGLNNYLLLTAKPVVYLVNMSKVWPVPQIYNLV